MAIQEVWGRGLRKKFGAPQSRAKQPPRFPAPLPLSGKQKALIAQLALSIDLGHSMGDEINRIMLLAYDSGQRLPSERIIREAYRLARSRRLSQPPAGPASELNADP